MKETKKTDIYSCDSLEPRTLQSLGKKLEEDDRKKAPRPFQSWELRKPPQIEVRIVETLREANKNVGLSD